MTRLAQYREFCNLRQEDAAVRLGVDRTTISKWETGESYPRAEMLPKIASLYNCTSDNILAAIAAGAGTRKPTQEV